MEQLGYWEIFACYCLGFHLFARLLGGLSIKSIHGINKLALLHEVWNILLNHPTCWNLWIRAKYLRRKSFWDVHVTSSASFGWRGILSLRPVVLPYIRHLIIEGRGTQFWSDPWLHGGRIRDIFP